MIYNSLISIVAGGIMLASKWLGSYEMVIVARILYGFSSGKPTGRVLCEREDSVWVFSCFIWMVFLKMWSKTGILVIWLDFTLTASNIKQKSHHVVTWLYLSGVGLSLHVMYVGESSPRKIRGRVTLTVATFLSLGKLSGQFFGLTYALMLIHMPVQQEMEMVKILELSCYSYVVCLPGSCSVVRNCGTSVCASPRSSLCSRS